MPRYVREAVEAMTAYVPGETPARADAVKLNQNESAYPPSPHVAEAVRDAVAGLRRYPDSAASALRATAARVYGLPVERVMATNGSDEFLRILFQACAGEGEEVVAFYPSYTYYRTLAEIEGARYRVLDFTDDYALPDDMDLSRARLVFLPNPNAPSGTLFAPEVVDRLCRLAKNGVVCIDEAYIDYADPDASALSRVAAEDAPPNLVVARTLSKSYGLAGLRVGLGFGPAALMAELDKVRDYYNLDVLAQAAAMAALDDQDYLRETVQRVAATRERVAAALRGQDFFVWPSQANFLLVRMANPAQAKDAFLTLREKGVYVRYFNAPRLADSLRVSIGTDDEMDTFLAALSTWRTAPKPH